MNHVMTQQTFDRTIVEYIDGNSADDYDDDDDHNDNNNYSETDVMLEKIPKMYKTTIPNITNSDDHDSVASNNDDGDGDNSVEHQGVNDDGYNDDNDDNNNGHLLNIDSDPYYETCTEEYNMLNPDCIMEPSWHLYDRGGCPFCTVDNVINYCNFCTTNGYFGHE